MGDRIPTTEENKLAAEAAMVESKAKIAEAEVKLAQAKKDMLALSAASKPPTAKESVETTAAIAAAEQKTLQSIKDSWKGPDIKALEGKITATGNFMETGILASKALNKAVGKMVERIKNANPFKTNTPVFFIYNATDFSSMELYYSMTRQMKVLEANFTGGCQEADSLLAVNAVSALESNVAGPALAASVAAGALRSVIDIVSLFRTNTTYTTIDVTVEDTQLVAAFAQAALKQKWKIFHTAVMPPGVNAGGTGAFEQQWTRIKLLKQELDKKIGAIDALIAEQQEGLVSDPPPDAVKKESINARIAGLTAGSASLQSLVPVYQQLEKLLVSTDASGLSLLSMINRAEKLVNAYTQEHAVIIKLAVTAKGSHRITERLWRSAQITFSGGCALSCLIFSGDGAVVFGHTTEHYINYTSAENIGTVES